MKKSNIFYPLRENAGDLSEVEKIKKIESHFRQIMETLGLDLLDDSLCDTPKRVAKMYVKEIFGGLRQDKMPSCSTFENKYAYHQMLVEKNISLYSTCEHHFLPIVGKAQVAYIPNKKVIGLSKINRLVEYYSKRPQTQERLTLEIVNSLQDALQTFDVACLIDAKHLCVNSRGIKDVDSSTVTYELGGKFREDQKIREEFFAHAQMSSSFRS